LRQGREKREGEEGETALQKTFENYWTIHPYSENNSAQPKNALK